MFLFTTTQDRLVPGDPQNPEARWFSIEEVAGRLSNQKDREFFEGIKNEFSR